METAWFLFHRLRECPKGSETGPLGGEGKVVEVDETYVGGKEGNKHANKRTAGRGAGVKASVVTLVERDGSARSFHVANVTAKTIRKIVMTNASRQSHLMTDGAIVYIGLGGEFAGHSRVDHSAGEYVREGFHHSNTVESYFAILKRGVYGSFHSISESHLHRYLIEFDFKYTTRRLSDYERAETLLKGATGKRLMYRHLRKPRTPKRKARAILRLRVKGPSD